MERPVWWHCGITYRCGAHAYLTCGLARTAVHWLQRPSTYSSSGSESVPESLICILIGFATPLPSPTYVTEDLSVTFVLSEAGDEFLRLILYLMVFSSQAKGWIYQDVKIGYDRSDNKLNEGFKPEWHHFFPKKILKDREIDDTKINVLSNIVVLNERANRRFRASPPETYIQNNNVDMERLQEQMVPTNGDF